MISLSVLLFAAAAPPPIVVSVDTSGGAAVLGAPAERRLRGSLLVRLVEEGYVVVPDTRQSQVRVALRPSGDGWAVAAGDVEYHVAPGRPPIVELEILHRATMAVQAAERGVVDREPSPHSAAIEVSASPDDTAVRGLQEELAFELLAAGIPLAPVSAIHDRTLRIVANGDDIQVFATSDSAQGREPATTLRRRDSQSDVMNAASRAVATLTKSSPRPDSVGGVASEPIPGSENTRAPTPSEALPSKDRRPTGWTMATGLGAGLLLREGGTDPRLEGALHASRSNVGARLEGDFISSRSPGGSLSVTEWSIKVGPRWQHSFSRKTALGVALVGGLAIHRFHFSDGDNGSLFGGALSFPVDFSFQVGSWAALTLSTAAALSLPNREHDVLGTVGWYRSNYSLGVTAGLRVMP
jgi:hypothetical protein